MAKSGSALEHDESEGRPSVEAVPDDLRAQVAAGQCVAIRGECGYEVLAAASVLARERRKQRHRACVSGGVLVVWWKRLRDKV